jgi:hypothetical protein
LPPFQLAKVSKVEFYKRDELTTDLICCDITVAGKAGAEEVIFAHEDMPHWDELIHKLEFLGGFDVEWFSEVSQPAFAESRYMAFLQKPAK